MAETAVAQRTPMDMLKKTLSSESVQEQFKNALQDNSGPFVASIIDLVGSDANLRACDPKLVIMECLKAATLKLTINKQLGFAYVVPYKVKGTMTPQFQIGYKGYIQLAMRTGLYRTINAGTIYEGIKVKRDILSGAITFSGEATSEVAQGYFCHFELLNGFQKTLYMTKAEIEAHAKKYSKSYGYESSPWKTNFDAMATKTCVRLLISKYGIMSIEMEHAIVADRDEQDEAALAREIEENANGSIIDVEPHEPAGEEQPKLDPGF